MGSEKKYYRRPFEIELARKIVSGEVEGRIVVDSDKIHFDVEILTFDVNNEYAPIVAILTGPLGGQSAHTYSKNGKNMDHSASCDFILKGYDLHIEVEENPFEIGDLVRVHLNDDKFYNYNYKRYNGSIGKIVNIDDDGCIRVFLQGAIARCAFEPEELEVVEKKVKSTKTKTPQPFDKVLVRSHLGDVWRPAIFQYYSDSGSFPYKASGEWFLYCIPYNGNEKLNGTTITPLGH